MAAPDLGFNPYATGQPVPATVTAAIQLDGLALLAEMSGKSNGPPLVAVPPEIKAGVLTLDAVPTT